MTDLLENVTMAEQDDGQQLIEQLITERKAAARLSLGPELLPLIMPLKICDGLLYDLGALELGDSLESVRSNGGRAETWVTCAGLFNELTWQQCEALRVHIAASVKARCAALEGEQ